MRLIPKEIESLWTLFTGPTVWALHFLVCYITISVHCAKADGAASSFHSVRLILGVVTGVALAGIVLAAYLAWRQWGFGSGDPPHDEASRKDRLLFQGFATLLLSGLSFIAVLFVAMPLLFMGACLP